MADVIEEEEVIEEENHEDGGQAVRPEIEMENVPEIEHGPKTLLETMEELEEKLKRLQDIREGGGEIEEFQEVQIQVDDADGNLGDNVRLHRNSRLSLSGDLNQRIHSAILWTGAELGHGGTGLGMLPVKYLAYAYMALMGSAVLLFLIISDFGPTQQPGTLVDTLYVASSIMLSVGFGDITPLRPLAMFLCDGLALFGPVIVFILTYLLSQYAHDLELRVFPHVEGSRTGCRVFAALITIFLTIFLGMVGIYFSEWMLLADGSPSPSPSASLSPSSYPYPSPSSPGMLSVHASSWALFVDIFHLSVMMMTTTGFGDFAFTTRSGRVFAILWMPLSTTLFVVASAFLVETFLHYLTHPSTGDYSLVDTTNGN